MRLNIFDSSISLHGQTGVSLSLPHLWYISVIRLEMVDQMERDPLLFTAGNICFRSSINTMSIE